MRNLTPLFALFLFLIWQSNCQAVNCTDENEIIGCVQCDNPSTQSLVYDIEQKKMICIQTLKCVLSQGQVCIDCQANYVLNQTSSTCQNLQGCQQMKNSTCDKCYQNYFLNNGSNQCILKRIKHCIAYENQSTCLQCSQLYMKPQQNCTISTNLCQLFDESTNKCHKCPSDMYIHPNGIICVTKVEYCMLYSGYQDKCVFCKSGYFLNDTGSCQLNQIKEIQQTALIITYTLNLTLYEPEYEYKPICINKNKYFDLSTQQCTDSATNISHCLQVSSVNATLCSICFDGYYLLDGVCYECGASIQNCLVCSYDSNMVICDSASMGYYLSSISYDSSLRLLQSGQPMSCSSYGCQNCMVQTDPSTNAQRVVCTSCNVNETLYNGNCIKCSQEGQSFSIQDGKCISCSNISNCVACSFTNQDVTQCKWCSYGYFYNSSHCQNYTQSSQTSITIPNIQSAAQILYKLNPDEQQSTHPYYYFNNKASWMEQCREGTDGFICTCSQFQDYSSTCFGLSQQLADIDWIVNATELQFAQYSNVFRMASQFTIFGNSPTSLPTFSTVLLTTKDYWNLLATYSNALIRNQQDSARIVSGSVSQKILQTLSVHPENGMINSFSQQKVTILYGNGWYYKYIPEGISNNDILRGDDGYIYTNIGSTNWRAYYIFYDKQESLDSYTGQIYVFAPSNLTSSFSLTVKKSGFPQDSDKILVKKSGITSSQNVTLNNGYLTISSVSKTTDSAVNGYQLMKNQSASEIDIYRTQRIEYIFYNQSFLYILFFLLLYLIFIPLCSIVDCCQNNGVRRKRISSEEENSQQIRKSSQNEKPSETDESQDETIIKVNYRDFFPIYSVGNAPRSKRIPKICLLIVNLQHGVTFLTLIYFNLDKGNEVGAIGLAIAGYLCTIVMGYIVGGIFRYLPGRSKYLINLVSVGYWIIWVVFMRRFASSEYKLFLLVFAIIFFIIDLLLDSFEMLLVYFAIKQGDKDISTFNCLARWLSFRGYYDFDRLAKKMNTQSE